MMKKLRAAVTVRTVMMGSKASVMHVTTVTLMCHPPIQSDRSQQPILLISNYTHTF